MSTAAQQLLNSFESLPGPEQHQVAVEILRRASLLSEGDIPEQALTELADELFQALDAEEAKNAQG